MSPDSFVLPEEEGHVALRSNALDVIVPFSSLSLIMVYRFSSAEPAGFSQFGKFLISFLSIPRLVEGPVVDFPVSRGRSQLTTFSNGLFEGAGSVLRIIFRKIHSGFTQITANQFTTDDAPLQFPLESVVYRYGC